MTDKVIYGEVNSPLHKKIFNDTITHGFIDSKTGGDGRGWQILHHNSRRCRRAAERLHKKNLEKIQRRQEKRND